MKLVRELRLALRGLRRAPLFTVVVVLTLAVAIGANVALYAVVDAVLLSPLPFPEPERLVAVWDAAPADGLERSRVSASNFDQWRRRSHSFAEMAAYGYSSATLLDAGEPVRLRGARISEGFFPLLGVTPRLGRTLSGDDFLPDAPLAVVVSHALWQRRLGADPAAVGRKLRLDDSTYTVVGVLPPQLLPLTAWADGHVELAADREFYWLPHRFDPTNGHSHVLGVLGRLRPAVELAEARAEMGAIAARLEDEYPASNRGYTAVVASLRDEAVGDVETSLWLLWGAVGLVLLTACANVGGLLLARADERRRELAIRAALGAGPLDRLRALAGEGVLLVAGGAALGTLLAGWLLALLPRLSPGAIPRLDESAVDGRALAATVAAALLCTLVVSLLATFSGRRGGGRLDAELRSGERAGDRAGGLRLRRVLVAAETALAIVLLIGAGLLARSFARLSAQDPGFTAAPTLAVELQHPPERYAGMERLTGFYDRLFAELGALPGVEAVAAAYDPPLRSNWYQGFRVAGAPADDADESTVALFRTVTPGYFDALGIELRRGRDFDAGDRADTAGVAIVNEAFVRRFLAGRQALGRELEIGTTQWMWGDAIPTTFRVVGVVQDVRFAGLAEPSEAAFYLPYRQTPQQKMTLLVRTGGEPTALLPAVRRAVRRLDPELPLAGVTTLDEILSAAVARPRFDSAVLAAFAAAALLLAVLGTWGVLAASVARRRREIGVRLALGSGRRGIFALVLRDGLAPALAGTALGLLAALAAGRLLRGLLFGVGPADPLTYAAVPLLLLLVSAAACLAPARRAVRVDPVRTLRGD